MIQKSVRVPAQGIQLLQHDTLPMNSRARAAMALTQVFNDGHSLSAVLAGALDGLENHKDKGMIQELCYGVLRWYPRLEWLANRLLDRPLKARDRDVYNLVLVGLYQFMYMRVPAHAVVNETVDAVKQLGKPWARNMVNAVLRSFQRDRDSILTEADQDEEATTAHPAWLLAIIRKNWPGDWQQIVHANNQRPPMCLRVNRLKTDRASYLQALADQGIAAQATAFAEDGIELEKAVEVGTLPGFTEGRVSVQDAAAQLAAPLLDMQPGQRVLDACAAPGGKTGHILEVQPTLRDLIVVDIDGIRLRRIEDNLRRLGFRATLVRGDATSPEKWWDGTLFDRILLDAPCSATGVIRRHPDIKRLRRPDDIAALVELQRRLLISLWPLLRPGGMLLYVTCSILAAENDGQMKEFLKLHTDARENKIESPWGRLIQAGRQVLPGEYNMDGFYFASISKQ
ncbi:MAG TPA: 16S rRNA (cytosine(967)-C(5))-methyltransferase RsmB [Gammaproteobacteria bacterium]